MSANKVQCKTCGGYIGTHSEYQRGYCEGLREYPPITDPQALYIAGPMTGYVDFNFPAFHAAAKKLRDRGFTVINPAELCPEKGKTWEFYMRKDLIGMLSCKGIYLLPGWTESRGARLEASVAEALNMEIYQEGSLEP